MLELFSFIKRLKYLEKRVTDTERQLHIMTVTQQQFDAELAQLLPAVQQVETAINNLLTQVAAQADYSNEFNTVQTALNALKTIGSSAAAPAVATTQPASEPAPATEPATPTTAEPPTQTAVAEPSATTTPTTGN